MALETKHDLNDSTVEKLQKLIQCNVDSSDGFREAAEEISDSRVAGLFREMASQRSNLADQLKTYVEWNGERAEDDGSFAASVHRAWIDVRGKLNGGDPRVILIEAERGEDYIKEAYEDVLKETAGSAMNDILQSQYATVKRGHDQIRDLRDEYKNKD